MPNERDTFSIACSLPAIVPAELVSKSIDVRKELSEAFGKRVKYILTGPDPQPVFLPETDTAGEKYRGLLLVPHAWDKNRPYP